MVSGNSDTGFVAADPGTTITLRRTTVENTQPGRSGELGQGVYIYNGASLDAQDCQITQNTSVGLFVNGAGTSVNLLKTTIEDTQPDTADGNFGQGIQVTEGASLVAENCTIRDNHSVGVAIADSGTTVILKETTIEGTKAVDTEAGYGNGIDMQFGASLYAEACTLSENTAAGIFAKDPGTTIHLQDTLIEKTLPDETGMNGYGLLLRNGAHLTMQGCEISENTAAGLVAAESGTSVTLHHTAIKSTYAPISDPDFVTAALGLVAQQFATIDATNVTISETEGPGIYASSSGHLSCTRCSVLNNEFAGAIAIAGTSLELTESLLEDTTESPNIGGGIGVYGAPHWGTAPTLTVTNTTIRNNPVAGVWLSGNGNYSLTNNIIHGGTGWSRTGQTWCGDAVYAQDGVTSWNDNPASGEGQGLLLENNEIRDGLGAGLFLNNASATLNGNTYADNQTDLISQGSDCSVAPEGYNSEA